MSDLSNRAEAILENIIINEHTTNPNEVLDALEDGATLEALGITDDDQQEIEELHAFYTELVKQ